MQTGNVTVGSRLPTVGTRAELMSALEDMIAPRKSGGGGRPPWGTLHELKTYVLESDRDFPRRFKSGGMRCEAADTGLDAVKILRARRDGDTAEFFLDMEDKRFPLLHTNGRSEYTDGIVGALAGDDNQTIDNIWLHSAMLERLARMPGNSGGPGAPRRGGLPPGDGGSGAAAGGPPAGGMRGAADAGTRTGAAARGVARIARGSGADPRGFVQDDVRSDGRFAVRRGRSVRDHLRLVDMCREEYAGAVAAVEERRIGAGERDGMMLAEGGPFDFEFSRSIEDLDAFMGGMFDMAAPFKMWGLKSAIQEDYFGVIAADLHAGARMHFDIAPDLMRVYLYKRGCGNTVLRLLTNLQLHHDAGTTCRQIV